MIGLNWLLSKCQRAHSLIEQWFFRKPSFVWSFLNSGGLHHTGEIISVNSNVSIVAVMVRATRQHSVEQLPKHYSDVDYLLSTFTPSLHMTVDTVKNSEDWLSAITAHLKADSGLVVISNIFIWHEKTVCCCNKAEPSVKLRLDMLLNRNRFVICVVTWSESELCWTSIHSGISSKIIF